jgi:hypothetical protein
MFIHFISFQTNARGTLNNFRQSGDDFERMLKACVDVVESQAKQLESAQAYLTHYGFVAQKGTTVIILENILFDKS